MAPKYGLVQWLRRENNNKKYSVVPLLWVRNFNEEEYVRSSSNEEESYIIEWHDAKKEPPGGWRVYDGFLLNIHEKKSWLETKLKQHIQKDEESKNNQHTSQIEIPSQTKTKVKNKPLSPLNKNVEQTTNEIPTQLPTTDKEQPKKNDECLDLGLDLGNENSDLDFSPDVSEYLPSDSKESEDEELLSEDSQPKRPRLDELREKYHDWKANHPEVYGTQRKPARPAADKRTPTYDELLVENASLKDQLVKKIPEMLDAMQRAAGFGLNAPGPSRQVPLHRQEQKVELYPGTGVLINSTHLLVAQATDSPGIFVNYLLVNMFELETLLKSNYKGGKCKTATGPDASQRPGLDATILKAIHKAALAKFPTMRKGQFGAIVNNKLSSLRYKQKKVISEVV